MLRVRINAQRRRSANVPKQIVQLIELCLVAILQKSHSLRQLPLLANVLPRKVLRQRHLLSVVVEPSWRRTSCYLMFAGCLRVQNRRSAIAVTTFGARSGPPGICAPAAAAMDHEPSFSQSPCTASINTWGLPGEPHTRNRYTTVHLRIEEKYSLFLQQLLRLCHQCHSARSPCVYRQNGPFHVGEIPLELRDLNPMEVH